jgi:Spy/CpxP family protein refolding chaperone
LKKEKDAKLQAILTPEQKEKMKQKKETKPRRGVTNMPNEKTAK